MEIEIEKWWGWYAWGLQNICLNQLIIPKSCTIYESLERGSGLSPFTLPYPVSHWNFALSDAILLKSAENATHSAKPTPSSRFASVFFSIFNLQSPTYDHFLTILLKNTLDNYAWDVNIIYPIRSQHRCLRTEPIKNGSTKSFKSEGGWRDKEGWELRWKFWKYFLFWFTFMKIYIKHNNPTNLCYNNNNCLSLFLMVLLCFITFLSIFSKFKGGATP